MFLEAEVEDRAAVFLLLATASLLMEAVTENLFQYYILSLHDANV